MKHRKYCQTCKGTKNLGKEQNKNNTQYYKCTTCRNVLRRKYYNTANGKTKILMAIMRNYARRFNYKLTKIKD